MTLRTIFISKGRKITASITGVLEVFIWLQIASKVLDNISEDPYKVLAYVLGFGCGIYLGIKIKEKFVKEILNYQMVVKKKDSETIIKTLRALGFGLTIVEGFGLEDTKYILSLSTTSNREKELETLMSKEFPEIFFSVTEAKTNCGGYGLGGSFLTNIRK